MAKKRIDTLLVEQGFYASREKAQRAIMAGLVLADRQRVDKPGMKVEEAALIEIKGEVHPYVSRGGLKLEKAITLFDISLTDRVCMDIGASTGGFTDCMLQKGAARVYAVDVGYGQLDWKLRNDDRVVVMERTNIRHVTPDQISEPIDFISIDVSFISLKLVLPAAAALLAPRGELVALIKPQFEAGREQVGKNGVVRDPKIHEQVIGQVTAFSRELGLHPAGLSYSPIRGPKGNIEFLLACSRQETSPETVSEQTIENVVKEAHA